MSEDLDLFGNPCRPGYGLRGRPPHVPDAKSTNRVKVGLLLDRTEDEIAGMLGITPKTLRKHYSRLFKSRDNEKAQAEAGLLERMLELGMGGNASMMRLALERIEREREGRWAPRQSVDDRTGAPLGKKERAQKDASEASIDDWLRQEGGGETQPN